jgi:3-ketosteroid 9alpha-monooxygenase subunit B
MRQYALEVKEVERIGDDVAMITFDLPAELEDPFRFRAGQYLTLRVPLPDGAVYRSYSIAAAPQSTDSLRVGVRRVAGGAASGWLIDNARPGWQLDLLPPAGLFTPPDFDRNLLLVAGGSGITPVFSILRTALLTGTAKILLFYANRQRGGEMLLAELRSLAADYPQRLELRLWYDTDGGPPGGRNFIDLASQRTHWRAMVCGPAPLMRSASTALCEGGIAPEEVYLEEFVRPGPAAEPVGVAAGGGEPALVTMELAGTTQDVPCAPGEVLLDAALKAGLRAPYSCRSGNCAACLCFLVSGEVERLDNTVLDASNVAAGEILACKTLARSPKVHIRFSG